MHLYQTILQNGKKTKFIRPAYTQVTQFIQFLHKRILYTHLTYCKEIVKKKKKNIDTNT